MDYKKTWSKANAELKSALPEHAYKAWIETLTPIGLTNDVFIVEAPNRFAYDWINNNYYDFLVAALKKQIPKIELKISIATPSQQSAMSAELDKKEPTKQSNAGKRHNINPNNTFKTFIEGPNNQFAKKAAIRVSKTPGEGSFNPLIIYGGVGLGKTHLLHAIANALVEGKKPTNVVLASSEKFTNDFIASIQENKSLDFSRVYRKADILLIDDIQFFQGKEQTQEQFFHTFNDLLVAGKQIVMTADRYPGEMIGLQDRLLSRFESGLHADIQPPDFETRVAILAAKAKQNNVNINPKFLETIASHVKTNIRDLESCVTKLLAHATFSEGEIDEALVETIIRERLGNQAYGQTTVQDIINRVCAIFSVTEEEIVGQSRRKNIVEARQVVAYLSRKVLDMSLSSVGLHLGGRDHTTIMHAQRKIESLIKKDKKFKRRVDIVYNELNLN